MSEQKLDGELAIVTGSDSGIGQATAIGFAKERAKHPAIASGTAGLPSGETGVL